ncbi:YjgN family protein [Sphingomonas sp. XXL09]|uniref:YjgN family protein n=1 Tax=Sphingomonas sp. XXL09 TaxID=3457787 RepID=UPI00406BC34E
MTEYRDGGTRAFRFTGSWQQYAPIAFTNLLLTIVTLGIYSFWGKARTRRYLWSRTIFIDDRLEWTGTGLELFIGYLLAIVFFALPFGLINLILQGVMMRGHPGAGGLIVALLYLAALFLVGVARFRALRYRLSRTLWHGIRGGSDEQGVGYGLGYFWRSLVAMLTIWLMTPWSMAKLWNMRWNAMSFGSLRFHSAARWQPVFGRFLLFYLAPVVLFAAMGVLIGIVAGVGGTQAFRPGQVPSGGLIVTFVLAGLAFYLIFFGLLGLIAMAFFSAFFREAVGATTLGDLSFGFEATTRDWVMLFLGNYALIFFTFGIGYIFVPYRNWAFFVRHMAAYGSVATDALTQSQTREPGQGEGLLDAFDVGAF